MALKAVHRTTGDAIADRRFAYAMAAFVDADWQTAIDLAGQTLELAPGFAPAHVILGRAQAATGHKAEAVAALSEGLALDPDDELGARIDLARLGALDADEAISEGYVRALFDNYAEGFEAHLNGALAYRGPALLKSAILAACTTLQREPHFDRAIDLGCGTGLMGRELAGMVDCLVGVDLSPAMVTAAGRTGVYNHLHVGNVVDFLENDGKARADLLVAADVIVYLGDLFPLLRETANVLEPGGLFAFTVQAHRGHGFVLGVDARYAHSEEYLRTVADVSGLMVVSFAKASTRLDRGLDVPGYVMVLTRP